MDRGERGGGRTRPSPRTSAILDPPFLACIPLRQANNSAPRASTLSRMCSSRIIAAHAIPIPHVSASTPLKEGGRRRTGSARDGVSGVCTSHRSRGLEVHEFLTRDDSREGEPVGDSLCDDEDVGYDGWVVFDRTVVVHISLAR
jgi:hypothetical protein